MANTVLGYLNKEEKDINDIYSDPIKLTEKELKHLTEKKVNNNLQNSGGRAFILRLVLSFSALVPLMYLSMGAVMWGAPLPASLAKNPISIALLEMLLSLFVMLVNSKFFKNGF